VRVFAVTIATGVMVGALATTALAAQYPDVGHLTPFSAEANYMSLPGYLRYLVHQQSGMWLQRPEAARVVRQQQAG
jgi:hypothetical protein